MEVINEEGKLSVLREVREDQALKMQILCTEKEVFIFVRSNNPSLLLQGSSYSLEKEKKPGMERRGHFNKL